MLYNSFLRSVGTEQETFGRIDPDLDLQAMQTGPLAELMA